MVMNVKPGQQLTIWVFDERVVKGEYDESGDKYYFVTKIEAEKALREMYPDMDADRRYRFIYFIETQPYTPE